MQVEPTRLVDGSQRIREIKGDLLRTMEDIECLVLAVGGAWQGDAERAYAEKILYVKQQFSHIAQFFGDYADLLEQFAYAYEQQESDMTSQINLV